jgi:pimeloyl-ACP methyl ester carboxylesterase
VFENGLGSEIGSWGALLGRVAKFAPVFAYDRPGIGGSEATNYRPTPSNVASLLHGLLSHTGAKPPFVLVGFSLGGAYVRMYAALYPDDVAGIVYIDPLDFTETRNDMLSTFVQAGLGESEMRQYDEALDRFARDNSSQPVIAEWEEFKTLQLDSYVEYTRIAPTPQVPQVLLASAKGQVPFVKFSFDFAAWANIANQQSLHRQLEWILSSPDGHFVATSSSPHKIHGNDQDLVVWAIRRLVFPDPAKRLRTLIDSGGQELISAEYRRLKATYPPDNLSDDILNLLGYELLYLERVDEALIVFRLNVEEFPDAWNPYDSLGEAFAVRGDLELAIQNYRRSLELNPENANGASRLSDLEIRLRSGEKLKPPGRPTTR